MKRVVVAVMSAAGAFALNAETVWKWTGEGTSNSVTDQKNWINTADGSRPGAKYSPYYGGEDVWVFDPGEGESVTLKLDHTGWPDFVIARRLEVLSGNVTIQGDASINGGSLQMDPAIGAATSTVHVAENATLTINAYVGAAYQASGISATSRIIAKTGKGTVTQNWTLGYGGGGAGRQPYLTLLDVRAGVFHRYSDASHYNSFVGDIYVHAGAEFGWNSYSMLEDDRDGKTQPSIHVEKGGLVRVGESSTTNVDGISGDGEWIFTGNHKIVMKLAKRDYVFGGEFKGSHLTMAANPQYTFTVASSNAFANLINNEKGFEPRTEAVRFAPNIGEFWMRRYCGDLGGTLNLVDTDGQPIVLHAGAGDSSYVTDMVLGGSGSYYKIGGTRTECGFVDGQLQVTGKVGSEVGGNLVLGRGDAATNPDLSAAAAVDARGDVTFNGGDTLTVTCPVYSMGALTVLGSTALAELYKTAGSLALDNRLEIGGGELVGPLNATWRNAGEDCYVRPRPTGLNVGYTSANGYLALNSCRATFGHSDGEVAIGSFSAADSTVTLLRRFKGDARHATQDILLDGSTLRFAYPQDPYNSRFPTDLDTTTGATAKPWTIQVGAKGACLESDQVCCFGESGCHSIDMAVTVETASGVETDGGLTLGLSNVLSLYRPIRINGPLTLTDAKVRPVAKAYENTMSVLGDGDLTVDNAWLSLSADTRAASGANGKLRLKGAGVISFREKAGTAATLTVGDENATASSLVRDTAGVLFLADTTKANSFDGSCGKLIVKGGVAQNGDGRIKLPVFSAVNGPSDGYSLNFLTYDPATGFSDFAGAVATLDGGADSVADIDAGVATCEVPNGETRQVSALRVTGSATNWDAIRTGVRLNEGAVLKVGNDTDPACVLLNDRGIYGRAEISGSGTLDFGTADAVIACSAPIYLGGFPALISSRIAGSGTLTFAGLFGVFYEAVILSGDNAAHTGDIYVSGLSVRCESDTAFGAGTVHVLGGSAGGGQICFSKEGVTISNPLTISGFGHHCFGSYGSQFEAGALWFVRDATVSGPVAVEGLARIGARKHASVGEGKTAGVGTFTGVISGGRIQLLKNEQPIVFAGANTYTDGTEVVSSTLVLKGPCSVGSGAVELDNGVLRFENTAPVTFANDVTGVGTIELAGTAPVTFAGKGFEKLPSAFRTLQPGSSVDIPDCAACTIRLGAGDVDLGGATVALCGFSGNGRVSNGRLEVSGELNPAGTGAIGTLTFDAGVLVADGATFVCDVAKEGADKIVVEAPFDLSSIAFRTVDLGGRGYSQDVFCTAGLSGTFSATVFAKKWHAISYGGENVSLSAVSPGMLLIVR